jgi:hemoglobin-like flavoprotein
LTQDSIARIIFSYDQIAPHIDDMVNDFYARVFKAAPETRALFRQDMTLQRAHLAATLALLVRNLQYQDILEESVMDLGAHHVRIGVRPEQYQVVRAALMESIESAAGRNWTPQLATDWAILLDHIISTMLKGAVLFVLSQAAGAKSTLPQQA